MEIQKKEIRIKIHSELHEIKGSLFSEEEIDPNAISNSNDDQKPEIIDLKTVATYTDDGERISISYDESESTGMEGSITTITFLKNDPSVVSMIRTGFVSTTLVFEDGKRHHCIHQTPYMHFKVCIRTIQVKNLLTSVGSLSLDYVVEIRGSNAERAKISLQILN